MKIIKYITVFCLVILAGVFGYHQLSQYKTVRMSGSYPLLTKSDLINDSQLIIKGKIKDILPAKWSNPDWKKGTNVSNVIQTDYIINIEKVFKGTPYDNENITLRLDGGKVDKVRYIAAGEVKLKVDNDLVLFLCKDPDNIAAGENYYRLIGGGQSVFLKYVKTNYDASYTNEGDRDVITLSTFDDEIKKEIEYRKNNPVVTMSPEQVREHNEKVFGK